MARAGKPEPAKTPRRRNTTPEPPVQFVPHDLDARGGRNAFSVERRQRNAQRFYDVNFGVSREEAAARSAATGKVVKARVGRVPSLIEAFRYLKQGARRDSYQYGKADYLPILGRIEIEMQELRKFYEANAQADTPRIVKAP